LIRTPGGMIPGWETLHRSAWVVEDWSRIESWFVEWESVSVPCSACWNHWLRFKRDNPPDFSSREKFFWWTFKAHNEVSHRLEKEVWSAERFVFEYAM